MKYSHDHKSVSETEMEEADFTGNTIHIAA
jgi:hypothetical protein